MSEDHAETTGTESTGGSPGGTDSNGNGTEIGGGGGKSLEEQLDDLKQQQADAAAAQLNANIADLTKLIEDTAKAEETYAEAYQGLKDLEARLKAEEQTLVNSLKAAIGDAGIAEIKAVVTEQVGMVATAAAARDSARTARDSAQIAADGAAATLAGAKAGLDRWRTAATSIGSRLKTAETLIEDIKKLRNANRRGEAYWKLALGDHAEVPGQEFIHKVLAREPAVIEPGALRGKIEAAWNAFYAARTASAQANAALVGAEADLKAQEAALTVVTKNLIKAIIDALAEREAASDAA